MQVSASDLNNTSQQTLIEAFPPVLVLHLNHVAEDGTTKTEESVQFTSKLNIPLGTFFAFLAATESENTS